MSFPHNTKSIKSKNHVNVVRNKDMEREFRYIIQFVKSFHLNDVIFDWSKSVVYPFEIL